MENAIEKIACVGCLSKEKTFFGEKSGFPLYKCSNCKMISLYKIPENSSVVYDAEYFSGGGGGFGYVNYDEDKEPMRESFKKYLDLIKKMSGGTGKLFDVGSATGFFLILAKAAGFAVSGVEMSDFAAAKAREKGLDVKTGTLDKVNFKDSQYDVLTLLDVLEHMPDPENDIKVVAKMLRSSGLLVVNTPDSGSLYAKVLGMKWHLIVPPEHIHYFNEKGMRALLQRNGFEILVVTRIGKKFTLEYVFNMLFKWLEVQVFQTVATKIKGTKLGTFSFPINFHDNMFVIAKKL